MLLINLIIIFFSIATSVGLECMSKVNQKCKTASNCSPKNGQTFCNILYVKTSNNRC